jgi:hypothetical protein
MLASPTFRTIFKEQERDVLNLFTVEGEGGYKKSEYTFMYKSSAFFTPDIAKSVKSIIKDDTRMKEFLIPGTTTKVVYMDNILRVVLGNNNKCVMYRDGNIDISNKTYEYPYLKNIMYDIKDTFCPSSYATSGNQYKQMLLLKNGNLIYINTYTRTNEVVALTGVQKFLTKNQGHKCDAIVGCTNGDIYHVWVGPTPTGDDGNGTNSGILKIDGIKHTELLFCTLGDDPENCLFCKKSEPQKIYRFVKNGNGSGTNFKILGLGTSPVITLTGDEYFLHGMAHEENVLLITNKRAIARHNRWTSNGWDYDLYPTVPTLINPKIEAKKIVTPTAYSMIIEDRYGKYWLCDQGGGDSQYLSKPVSYTFFDRLKDYLIPIRELNK